MAASTPQTDQPKSIPVVVSELKDLAVTYAKQQTIDPIKGLGRFLAFGAAGALAWGIGVVALVLAGLRAMQTETGSTFRGNWSWAPYLIVVVGGVGLIGLALSRISKRKGPGA